MESRFQPVVWLLSSGGCRPQRRPHHSRASQARALEGVQRGDQQRNYEASRSSYYHAGAAQERRQAIHRDDVFAREGAQRRGSRVSCRGTRRDPARRARPRSARTTSVRHVSQRRDSRVHLGLANGVSGASVVLKKVGEVTADELLACDALVVGLPIYFTNLASEVKAFFDNWALKFPSHLPNTRCETRSAPLSKREHRFRTARKPQCNLSMQRC